MSPQRDGEATLDDIAPAADVPLRNVYYHFKTKDAIIIIIAADVERRPDGTRTAADGQVAPQLPGLGGHRSADADPGPDDLARGRHPDHEHGLLVPIGGAGRHATVHCYPLTPFRLTIRPR